MTEARTALQNQVERWGAEAKRLADSGREVAAFDLYRKAADALPGAPWLQHRTAELARKLKRDEIAIVYYRRSAEGFLKAGFERKAIPPLRAAWALARQELPERAPVFIEVTHALARLLKEVRLLADSEMTIEHANDALRRAGVRTTLELTTTSTSANPPRETLRPTLAPRNA